MKKVKGHFYSGTSGLVTAIPQRDFPPEHEGKSRLAFYALRLNSIEINSSFYKLPKASTVSGWAKMVPPDFRFTFKLWNALTHEKGLAFQTDHVERNFGIIDEIGDKKGAVLVQFPPSLKIDALRQLENLLGVIAQVNKGWKIAAEFRHPSWYQENVYELLMRVRAGLVYHDKAGSATPLVEPISDFVYQRFHGPGGDYKGSYDDGFLYEYSLYIQQWREEGKTVYVYFNNTAGEALKNLNLLKRYVDGT
jgi:uncharacterized protein YecE (DUF72 family)